MASTDKIYLETNEISNLASSLDAKNNIIKDEFTNNCLSTLKMCGDCIQVTGLNSDVFVDSIKTIFDDINIRCNDFSNYLKEIIVPNYEKLGASIKNNFDSNFADKMSSLLGITSSRLTGITKQVDTNYVKNESKQYNSNEVRKKVENPSYEKQPNQIENEIDNIEHNFQEEIPENQEIVNSYDMQSNEEIPAIIVDEPLVENNPDLSGNVSGLSKGFKIGAGIAGVGLAAGAAGLVTHKVFEDKKEEQERKKKLDEIVSKNNIEFNNQETSNTFVNNL